MFTQTQTHLGKAFLSAVVMLLLLTTAGQCEMLSDDLQTTATPVLSSTLLTTQLDNRSMEEPLILRSYKSCGSEHADYCANGGKCMFPQDTLKPSCICTSSYSGPRCLFFSDQSSGSSQLDIETPIAIGIAVAMLLFVLAIVIYFLVCKRCKKSAPLIKSAPSELSV